MQKSFIFRILVLVGILAIVAAAIVAAKMIPANSIPLADDADQTFFEQFVIAGGPIVWFVLLPMSLLTVFLAVEHFLTIRRQKLLPDRIADNISASIRINGLAQFKKQSQDSEDLVTLAITEALTKGRGDFFRMRSLVTESLQDQAMRLLRRIEWIYLIGNVSPMVGLFGTVFGMIKLFDAIVIAGGQPQPAKLAGGISVALVTTFWGLFIAIPALALHGIFRNRIETLVSDAVAQADNVMVELRTMLLKQKRPPKANPQQPIKDIQHNKKTGTPKPLTLS